MSPSGMFPLARWYMRPCVVLREGSAIEKDERRKGRRARGSVAMLEGHALSAYDHGTRGRGTAHHMTGSSLD